MHRVEPIADAVLSSLRDASAVQRRFYRHVTKAHNEGRLHKDYRFHPRGKHGLFRPGSLGLAGKLESHLRPKRQATETRIGLHGKGADKTQLTFVDDQMSLQSTRQAAEQADVREAMADRARQDMIDAQFKPVAVKNLTSFTEAFGRLRKAGAAHAKVEKGDSREFDGAIYAEDVHVTGIDTATPMVRVTAFQELRALSAPSLMIISLENEKFLRPTPIQGYMWVGSQLNRDVVCLGLPGSGKTIAYLVPAVLHALKSRGAQLGRRSDAGDNEAPEKSAADMSAGEAIAERRRKAKEGPKVARPVVLILVPTPELAVQVYQVATRLANPCGVVTGLMAGDSGEIPHTVDMIVATPDRIVELSGSATPADEGPSDASRKKAKKKKKTRKKKSIVDLTDIELLVVDEADFLMQEQTDVIDTILLRRGVGTGPLQTFMVASTWSPVSAINAKRFLREDASLLIRVGGEDALPSVSHRVHVIPGVDRAAFISLMFSSDAVKWESTKTIIFASEPSDVRQLRQILIGSLPPSSVVMLTDEDLQYQRDLALQAFHSGEARVLIATDVAARGLHVDKVGVVINYDVPKENTHATLTQRNGRTGRGESKGVAHTLLSQETPKEQARAVYAMLHPRERSSDVSDFVRDDGEKSSFVKRLEMKSRAKPSHISSFDSL